MGRSAVRDVNRRVPRWPSVITLREEMGNAVAAVLRGGVRNAVQAVGTAKTRYRINRLLGGDQVTNVPLPLVTPRAADGPPQATR